MKAIARINQRELPESTPGGFAFRYIDIGAVSTGAMRVPEEITFAVAPSRARRLAPVRATVVSTVRTYLRAIAPVTEPGLVFSTGLAVLEAKNDVDPRYLYYSCLSEPFLAAIEAASTGVSYPAVTPDALANLDIEVLSEPEQRRIADFLDDQVARLDAAVTRAGDLDRLADERSHILQEALFDGLEAPVLRLGSVAQVQSGVTLNAAGTPGGGRSYPYLRVANVQDGWLDLRDVKEVLLAPATAAQARLRSGDVLMTEGGDLDKLGRGTVWRGEVESCVHQNHVFAVRPRLSALLPEFLAVVTRAASSRVHFRLTARKTTNLASTNSANIKDLRLPVPALAQQEHLVARARAVAVAAEAQCEEARRVRALLQERKRALITACVTGEFDVATASSRAAAAALAGAG